MNTLIQADIFFFITTISVIIFTILASIAMYYLIGGLKSFKRITKNLEHKIDDASDEVDELKHRVSQSFIFNLLFAKKPKKGRVSKK
jgi:cell division protein FtsL